MSYLFVGCFLFLVCAPYVTSQNKDTTTTPTPTTATTTQASTSTSITTQAPIPPSTTGPQSHNVNFSLVDNVTNIECARVTGTFQLSIKYTNTSGSELVNQLYVESPTGELKAKGNCDSKEQVLLADFNKNWTLGFHFKRVNLDTDTNYATTLSLLYIVDEKYGFFAPKTNGTVFVMSGSDLFSTSNNKYYVCDKEKSISFNDSVTTLAVSYLKLQAFKTTNSNSTFVGDMSECLADHFSDSNLVPIIVGVCLAALVIVILVAYFIGRWRTSRNPAYQPV